MSKTSPKSSSTTTNGTARQSDRCRQRDRVWEIGASFLRFGAIRPSRFEPADLTLLSVGTLSPVDQNRATPAIPKHPVDLWTERPRPPSPSTTVLRRVEASARRAPGGNPSNQGGRQGCLQPSKGFHSDCLGVAVESRVDPLHNFSAHIQKISLVLYRDEGSLGTIVFSDLQWFSK